MNQKDIKEIPNAKAKYIMENIQIYSKIKTKKKYIDIYTYTDI